MKQEEISCIDQHFLAFCHITFRKSKLKIFLFVTLQALEIFQTYMVSYQLFLDQGTIIIFLSEVYIS